MKKSILSQEQATIKYPWLEHLCHACQINMTHISFSEDEIGPQLLNLVIDKNFKRKDRLYVLTDKKGNELGYVGYDQEEISLFSPIANLCSLFDVPHYGDDLEMETVKNAIIRNDHSLEKITYVVE
ncbi:MAG: hypothetical protein WCO30_01680, partial [bacterium]